MENNIDYTARDYAALKEALRVFLQQRVPNEYTDYTESALGVAFLEMVAYAGEIVSFYMDRIARESYLSTARERRNVIRRASAIGYTPALAIAASVDMNVNVSDLALNGTPYGTVTIEKGEQIKTGSITFETDRQYIITNSGGNWLVNGEGPVAQPQISLIQGESRTQEYTGTGGFLQRVILPSFPVIAGSIAVTVDSVAWTQVDSLILGDPEDSSNRQIYEVDIDENDQATVKFADGVTADVVPDGSDVEIEYRVGGGTRGNVAAQAINGGLPADADGNPVTVNVYNPLPASGGADRESTERIKFFAPLYVKTNDRAITKNDFKTLSASYISESSGRVSKSGVIADPSDGLSNVVSVYLWTEDNTGLLQPASSALRDEVRSYLEERKLVTVMVTTESGRNVNVTATAHIHVKTQYNEQDVKAQVETAWENLINSSKVRQNNELRHSWILDEINRIPGVDWVHLTQFAFTEPEDGDNLTGLVNFSARSFGYKNYPPASEIDQVSDLNANVVIFSVDENTPDNPAAVYWGDGTTQIQDVPDYYCNYFIRIALDNGQIEIRRIIRYTAEIEDTSLGRVFVRRAVVDNDFSVTPQPNNPFEIFHPRLIRFADSEETDTAIDQKYKHRVLYVAQGIGASQSRMIIDFDPVSKVAMIDEDWTVYPEGVISGNQSKGVIYPDIRVMESEAIVSETGISVVLRQDESG